MMVDQRIVDVTGERFDLLDVYESYVSMDFPRQLPRDLTLWVWGARVYMDLGDEKEDWYAKGYVPLTFRDVMGFSLKAFLYYDNGNSVHDSDGKNVVLERRWGDLETEEGVLYKFEGVAVWPHSECSFQARCRGAVTVDLTGVEIIPDAPVTARALPPELERLRGAGRIISPAV